MNANMVRMGGIAIFVMLAVAIIGSIVIGAASVKVVDGQVVSTGPGAGGIILNIIQTLLLLFAMWATKAFFNAKGHTKSDLPIIGIMACTVVMLILGFVGGSGLGAIANPRALVSAAGVIGIISLIVLILFIVFYLMLSIQMIGFGNVGGGIWKALGILVLITFCLMLLGFVLIILGVVAESGGLALTGGTIAGIGALVALAALIVWGIALIIGASKMTAVA